MNIPQPVVAEFVSVSPEDTRRAARSLAGLLAGGDVVALVGPLGVGKTQWVKGLASGMGIDPADVRSPTFTLINEYPTRIGPVGILYHVDVYRLAGPRELEAIGFAELLSSADSVIAVEWADRVAELMPARAVWIEGSMPPHAGPSIRHYRVRTFRPDLAAGLSRALPTGADGFS